MQLNQIVKMTFLGLFMRGSAHHLYIGEIYLITRNYLIREANMHIQLPLECNQKRIIIMSSILPCVDQTELINGLIELYIEFIQIKHSKGGNNDDHDK